MLETPLAVRRAAMDLLARREHSALELQRKLRQRGADSELIEPELEKLAAEGLLCEQRYLESYVRSRARSGRGPARICEELAQRGLDRSAIEQELEQCGVDWDEQLRELWQRKFGRQPADAREYGKQARFLLYRGFDGDAVQRLLRR